MTVQPITRHEVEVDTRISAAYEVYFECALSARSAERELNRLRDRIAGGRTTIYDAQHEAEYEETLRQQNAAEDEAYSAYYEVSKEYDGWSRFYLVQNANGHIHSSMACSTCTFTTRFAWLTSVSGLTEAEAVAEHGERLCNVCFPSAPSAWTDGKAYYARIARENKEARAAEKVVKADALAAKKAKRAETYHYGLRLTRASDGFVIDHTLDRWFTPTTLKAAQREAKQYAGGPPHAFFSRVEVVDSNTGGVVA